MTHFGENCVGEMSRSRWNYIRIPSSDSRVMWREVVIAGLTSVTWFQMVNSVLRMFVFDSYCPLTFVTHRFRRIILDEKASNDFTFPPEANRHFDLKRNKISILFAQKQNSANRATMINVGRGERPSDPMSKVTAHVNMTDQRTCFERRRRGHVTPLQWLMGSWQQGAVPYYRSLGVRRLRSCSRLVFLTEIETISLLVTWLWSRLLPEAVDESNVFVLAGGSCRSLDHRRKMTIWFS